MTYLLLHYQQPLSRRQIAFLFWPDSTEKQAQANLRKLLHQLRRILPQLADFLDVTAQTIQWQANASITVDAVSFATQVEQAQKISARAKSQQMLEHAVELYKGDLLPDFYDDWVLAERERLRELYTNALHKLAELAEAVRDYQAALGWTQRLLQHDPLQETSYRQLMRLHLLAGDRAKALSSYHICATTLHEELGVEPSQETEELRHRVLRLEKQEMTGETAVSLHPASTYATRDPTLQHQDGLVV